MKRIYVSLTNRVPEEGMSPEDYGEIIVLDWDTKSIIDVIAVDSENEVEFGRSRGVGGMAIYKDGLYCVTRTCVLAFLLKNHTLAFKYTPQGNPEGFHGVTVNDKSLHIACMGHQGNFRNTKLSVDLEHRTPSWSETKHTYYNGGCFNAINFSPSGDEYHLYSGPKEIYNLTKDRTIKLPPDVQAPHDLHFLDDNTILYTDSNRKLLFKLDIQTGRSDIVFRGHTQSDGEEYARTGWLRGIASSSDIVFVAAAPGTLCALDKTTYKVLDFFDFIKPTSSKTQPAPFDVLLHPNDWN